MTLTDGWLSSARRWPAHPGRLGGAIKPVGVVMHTTDTLPGGMPAICRAWQREPGGYNAAHFLIGRQAAGQDDPTPTGGIVQFASILRNANHAGGKTHGWLHTPTGRVHPNVAYVGVELDAGGLLRRMGSAWIHPDTRREVPASDVHVDERGHGWHVVTDYQLGVMHALLDELEAVLAPMPDGAHVEPNGTYLANGVTWAALPWAREVGHVTLDPLNKTDPGPQVIGWLRARAEARALPQG